MPSFERAVNPLERRGLTVIQRLLQELSGLRASKLGVIGQVIDEKLAARPAVDTPITKNLLRIATSDLEETIVAKCDTCGTIKARDVLSSSPP